MNLLLWTGHVTEQHAPLLHSLKNAGYDGVEIPIFDASDTGHYRRLAALLDDIGLACTAVTTIPDEAHSPIAPDAGVRQAGFDHLARVIDCCQALGSRLLCGPWYQPLGIFTGTGPQPEEYQRCAEVHRRVAPLAREAEIVCALEVLNRFECYLLNTCDQASAYLDHLDEPDFGIHFDTFHANIEEKDSVLAVEAAWQRGHLRHVHISENDRGTPGRGQARIRETISTLKALGYDGWLTIEAFGSAVPELTAATRVWRPFFTSPEDVYTEGYRFIRECWNQED